MLIAQKGIALIEVLVAAVIVAIGLSGMGALLLAAIQATQDSSQTSQGVWIVQDYIGRMKSNIQGALDGDYATSAAIDCDTPPSALCANTVVGGTRVTPNACTSTQMATFDQWNVICGTDADAMDSAGEFLRSPSLVSTCTTFDANSFCTRYTVTLTWESANANTTSNQYTTVVEIE